MNTWIFYHFVSQKWTLSILYLYFTSIYIYLSVYFIFIDTGMYNLYIYVLIYIYISIYLRIYVGILTDLTETRIDKKIAQTHLSFSRHRYFFLLLFNIIYYIFIFFFTFKHISFLFSSLFRSSLIYFHRLFITSSENIIS